jgi:hypothetical protein
MALLEYWSEWPPAAELLRGFVGYKPLTKEERAQKEEAAQKAAQKAAGPVVPYESLPKWLRDKHAANKVK